MNFFPLMLWLRMLTLVSKVFAGCLPEISFQSPSYNSNSLDAVFRLINGTINKSIDQGNFQDVSFSVEIASSTQTLFGFYHTAETAINGTQDVSGTTRYRIASNTKLFTALGILQQQNAGNLALGDSVSNYVSDLRFNTRIDWSKITIRALMAHMGGIPDNYAENDVLLSLTDPTAYGLPPVSSTEESKLPTCEGFSNFRTVCSEQALIQYLQTATPLFAPDTVSSYSNIGYDLLGLVLSNVTGVPYEDYISTAILEPLNMEDTSFTVPDMADSVAPDESYFGVDLGVGNPSGGIYSTSADMIKFLQNALKTHDNVSSAMNWFQPATYGPGSHSYIGYPWEIFRSAELLPNSTRAVTVNTKGGGLIGFYSYSMVIPVYDLVVFMAAGGNDSTALSSLNGIFDAVREALPPAAETIAQTQLAQNYTGTYTAAAAVNIAGNSPMANDSSYNPTLNSSITISQSSAQSLYISNWISNSTDALEVFRLVTAQTAGISDPTAIYFQFIPTFETRTREPMVNDGTIIDRGEVWRFINVLSPSASSSGEDPSSTEDEDEDSWADYCISVLDPLAYAQKPLNEVVFWYGHGNGNINGTADDNGGEGEKIVEIELTAFDIRMGRT